MKEKRCALIRKIKKMSDSDVAQIRLLREQFIALDSQRTDILRQIAEWKESYDRMSKAVLELEEKYAVYK